MKKLLFFCFFYSDKYSYPQTVSKPEIAKNQNHPKRDGQAKETGIPFMKAEWKDVVARGDKGKKYIF